MSFRNPWLHVRKGGVDYVKREADQEWQVAALGEELFDSERGYPVIIRAWSMKPFILIAAPATSSECSRVGTAGVG